MTQAALKKFRVLVNETENNSVRVQKKLSKAGKQADGPMVASAAKYYTALKKLAEK